MSDIAGSVGAGLLILWLVIDIATNGRYRLRRAASGDRETQP